MSPAVLAVIQLIVQYGIPGFIQIYQTIAKDTPITQADLDRLSEIKPPSEWFTPPVAIPLIPKPVA